MSNVSLAAPELLNNGAAKLGERRIAHFGFRCGIGQAQMWRRENTAIFGFSHPSAQKEPVL
jgi:hypothetical protein